VVKVNNIDGVTEDKAYFLPRGFPNVEIVSVNEVSDNSLWLAYRAREFSDREPPLRSFVVRGYKIVDERVVPAADGYAIFVKLEK